MNSERNVLKRLLRLYPVKTIKEAFNIIGTGEELIDNVVRRNLPDLIRDFAYTHIELTKQHIYIYEFATNYNLSTFNSNAFPFRVLQERSDGNEIRLIISPIVGFNVILNNPFEESIMNFHQPYIITITNRRLIFQATILEKNMASYFEDGRKIINVEKLNDETVAIGLVLDFFSNNRPQENDLNRGVKFLWANDSIDAKYAKWKKDRSTATETMDEDYTLKTQYPAVYADLITRPLSRNIFRYLLDDELLPDHFTIDPSRGEISVPLYPKNQNQIQNVITQILSNN